MWTNPRNREKRKNSFLLSRTRCLLHPRLRYQVWSRVDIQVQVCNLLDQVDDPQLGYQVWSLEVSQLLFYYGINMTFVLFWQNCWLRLRESSNARVTSVKSQQQEKLNYQATDKAKQWLYLGPKKNQSKPEESLPRGLLGFLNKWTLCLFLCGQHSSSSISTTSPPGDAARPSAKEPDTTIWCRIGKPCSITAYAMLAVQPGADAANVVAPNT